MNWIRKRLLPGIEYFSFFALFLPGVLVSAAGLTSFIFMIDYEILRPHKQLIEKSLNMGATTAGIGLVGLMGSAFLAAMHDAAVDRECQEFEEQHNQNNKISYPYPKCQTCKYYSRTPLLPCAVHPELKVDCSDWEPPS